MIALQRLRERLHYDPETGRFTWLVWTVNHVKAGDIAGSLHVSGRWQVRVDGRVYKAHRLAWFWTYGEWPKGQIDHIDGNPLNNRLGNLRDVSVSVNQQNMKRAKSNNKTGFLGVCPEGVRFKASITINRRQIYIGTFSTPELAHMAYLDVKRALHPGSTL